MGYRHEQGTLKIYCLDHGSGYILCDTSLNYTFMVCGFHFNKCYKNLRIQILQDIN